jgi:hypothetical protein
VHRNLDRRAPLGRVTTSATTLSANSTPSGIQVPSKATCAAKKTGIGAAWVHLGSQWLFAAGFAAIVWLAAFYTERRPTAWH